MSFDVDAVRSRFPALASGAVFFDNPGGTQVAKRVVERMTDYLVRCNANHGGAFRTSLASDAVLRDARAACADFLGAASPDEIVFGPNMTTLAFAVARALAHGVGPGDEVVVTRLDHDANVSPWTTMARDRGAAVRWVDVHAADCTLDPVAFRQAIGPRTRLVAVGAASNAVGTVNDVRAVAELAHAAGALCFVDAVQHAPHLPVDVRAMGCDLLACSAYKFFGPHVGVLWGRLELLERLPFYKVRPAPDRPPEKLETGTQNHEGIAGVLGAIEYLEELGRSLGAAGPRRAALAAAMEAIAAHERGLCARLLEGLSGVPGLRVYGITDPARLQRRVPTVSFTLQGWRPRALAERLAREDVYVWDGHYYALELVERLGLREAGGMLRVGLAHYNTAAEVDRLVGVLKAL